MTQAPADTSGEFRADLEALINRHSRENGSNTPDFILAEFLAGVLDVFDATVAKRSEWYGGTEGQSTQAVALPSMER